jgi:hypothetical protein
MSSTRNIHDRRLADAWATLKAHADEGLPLDPEADRLAFADPEFMLRRETRGIRFQLELLKPDLGQQAHGIENTIVVFGSARFRDPAGCGGHGAGRAGPAVTRHCCAAPPRCSAMPTTTSRPRLRPPGGGLQRGERSRATSSSCAPGGGPGHHGGRPTAARTSSGGVSVGLAIALPMEEAANPYVTPACPSSSTTSRCARCIS